MVWTVMALLGGLACAAIGGELFVRGTVGIAHAARLSPGIIAATIAAFATSSPELTVGINAALAGEPQISLGDALGSNVVNVAVVLGVALLMAPIMAPRRSIKRDFPVALLLPLVLLALLVDGVLSQIDGLVLLAGFAAWLVAVLRDVRAERSAVGEVLGVANPRRAIVEGLAGLGLLIAAGKLIVVGASGIAVAIGLSQFVIGATVVAIGTSVPEFATTIISRIKGHDDVGLGTILGSNIFNGLLIIGVTATMIPIPVALDATLPVLIIGFAALALTYPSRSGKIDKWRGGMLLGLYAVYLVAVLQ